MLRSGVSDYPSGHLLAETTSQGQSSEGRPLGIKPNFLRQSIPAYCLYAEQRVVLHVQKLR